MSMPEYAAMVATVGTSLFQVIRQVFTIFCTNDMLFAFVSVAVFGTAITLAIKLMIFAYNTLAAVVIKRMNENDEFNEFMKDTRRQNLEWFEVEDLAPMDDSYHDAFTFTGDREYEEGWSR